MLDRRTLLKFFPLAALLERIIASLRAKPAVVQPLDMIEVTNTFELRNALARGQYPFSKQPLFEVIPVESTMAKSITPIVRVCNDGVNNFVQVVGFAGCGRIIATFPYDDRSKKRAIGMACNFVRSNAWFFPDASESIRTHEELLGPERVAKRDEILKSYFASVDKLFGGPC
jgi:hypothetical protein